MPNHVHVLFLPLEVCAPAPISEQLDSGEREDSLSPLASILHSLKGYTAHKANKILDRHGAFWQHESYDHWVRDEDELERIVQYIDANAVSAKLARRPQDWYFCSAHDHYLTDGDPSGWLSLPT
jgi:putative DNA methylase